MAIKRIVGSILCAVLMAAGPVVFASDYAEYEKHRNVVGLNGLELSDYVKPLGTISVFDSDTGNMVDQVTSSAFTYPQSIECIQAASANDSSEQEYASRFSTDMYIDTMSGQVYTPDQLADVISSETRSKTETDSFNRVQMTVTIYFVLGTGRNGGANVQYVQLQAVEASIRSINGSNATFSGRQLCGEWNGWDITTTSIANSSTGWKDVASNTPKILATSPKIEWGTGFTGQLTGKARCTVNVKDGRSWRFEASVTNIFGNSIVSVGEDI